MWRSTAGQGRRSSMPPLMPPTSRVLNLRGTAACAEGGAQVVCCYGLKRLGSMGCGSSSPACPPAHGTAAGEQLPPGVHTHLPSHRLWSQLAAKSTGRPKSGARSPSTTMSVSRSSTASYCVNPSTRSLSQLRAYLRGARGVERRRKAGNAGAGEQGLAGECRRANLTERAGGTQRGAPRCSRHSRPLTAACDSWDSSAAAPRCASGSGCPASAPHRPPVAAPQAL